MLRLRPSLVLLGLIMVVVTACAPAAGRQAIPYLADQEDIIGTVIQLGSTLRPGDSHNYFSIESVGPGHVVLFSEPTGGTVFLGALFGVYAPSIRLSVTAFQQDNVSFVAVSVPSGSERLYELVINALDTKFRRAPQ